MPKFDHWSNDTEIKFFKEALAHFASPEQLFYKLSGGYFAYIPKGSDAEGQTLQSAYWTIHRKLGEESALANCRGTRFTRS
jgi:hypothetical protein